MKGWRLPLAVALLGSVAVGLGAARLLYGCSPAQAVRFFRAPSPTELTYAGAELTEALLAYRDEHGVFPASLGEIGFGGVSTFFGPWRYAPSGDRLSCTLEVGDYGRYLFEVSWSETGGWYVDS